MAGAQIRLSGMILSIGGTLLIGVDVLAEGGQPWATGVGILSILVGLLIFAIGRIIADSSDGGNKD